VCILYITYSFSNLLTKAVTPLYLCVRFLWNSLTNSFAMLLGTYIAFLFLYFPEFLSLDCVSWILCVYKLINALYVPANWEWLYWIFLSFFSFSNALNTLSLLYSFSFLLSASALTLSNPLTCFILKWYSVSISAYWTCLWLNFLVIRNPVRFLWFVFTTNDFLVLCKNTLHSFNAITIPNNSLL